jgi:hypothetical protein
METTFTLTAQTVSIGAAPTVISTSGARMVFTAAASAIIVTNFIRMETWFTGAARMASIAGKILRTMDFILHPLTAPARMA